MTDHAGAGKQWGGRFQDAIDARALAYSESISFDWRLYPYDIAASIAHARMLGTQGILDPEVVELLVQGLGQVQSDIEAGRFVFRPELEDIHTNIEAALREICGPEAAGRLHTGRSRNDQVATDLRLYLADEVTRITAGVRNLIGALLARAEGTVDLIMPGMTHLQHAQPVRVAHHLLAYVDMFDRDRMRFERAETEVKRLPLGAGAMAGTTFPIDREAVAEALGFAEVIPNSMAAVADRDMAIEVVSAIAMCMMHVSRLSEELILWMSSEFEFVELPDAFTTGSSMMPQKKNPDMAELARGKTGRVYGDLIALLTMMKGLPMTYNRDLQEEKPAIFDAIDTLNGTLAVFAPMIDGMVWRPKALAAACTRGFLGATDVADYLVTKGLPFRQAHEVVGIIVTKCIDQEKAIEDLTLEELRRFSSAFEADAIGRFTIDSVVEARESLGGTAKQQVVHALRGAKRRLKRNGGVGDVPPALWQAAPPRR